MSSSSQTNTVPVRASRQLKRDMYLSLKRFVFFNHCLNKYESKQVTTKPNVMCLTAFFFFAPLVPE